MLRPHELLHVVALRTRADAVEVVKATATAVRKSDTTSLALATAHCLGVDDLCLRPQLLLAPLDAQNAAVGDVVPVENS